MLGKIIVVKSPKEKEIGIIVDEHLGSNGIECYSLSGNYKFFVLLRDILNITKKEVLASRTHAVIAWFFDPEECYSPSHGKIHRDNDQPAIIFIDGTKEWWKEGYRHRENDKPARICPDGALEWYSYGTLHRINGPARITENEEEFWEFGKLIDRIYKIS